MYGIERVTIYCFSTEPWILQQRNVERKSHEFYNASNALLDILSWSEFKFLKEK